MSAKKFEDIRITGYKGVVSGTINDDEPQVVLTLSEEPTDSWKELFRQFWFGEMQTLPEDFLVRDAEIREGYLLLKFDYEALKRNRTEQFKFQKYLDEMKGLVQTTNKKYREDERIAEERTYALEKMFKQLNYD